MRRSLECVQNETTIVVAVTRVIDVVTHNIINFRDIQIPGLVFPCPSVPRFTLEQVLALVVLNTIHHISGKVRHTVVFENLSSGEESQSCDMTVESHHVVEGNEWTPDLLQSSSYVN